MLFSRQDAGDQGGISSDNALTVSSLNGTWTASGGTGTYISTENSFNVTSITLTVTNASDNSTTCNGDWTITTSGFADGNITGSGSMTITSNGNNSWTLTGNEISFTLDLSSTSAATLETEGTYNGTAFSIGESNAAKDTSDDDTPDENNNDNNNTDDQNNNQQETISITALNGNWRSSGELTGTVTMDGTVMTDRDLGFYIGGAAEGLSTCTAAFGVGIRYGGEIYEVNDRESYKAQTSSITSNGTNSWQVKFSEDTVTITLTSATEGTCTIKGHHYSEHYQKDFVYELTGPITKIN